MRGRVQSGSNGGEQSSTITTKCYIDASIPSEQQIQAPTRAGIGIHVQNLQVPGHSNLMIKAQAHEVTDPLQAEAIAMQLAYHGHCAYFPDCQLLVDTLKAPQPLQKPAHWRLGPLVAEICSNTSNQNVEIPR